MGNLRYFLAVIFLQVAGIVLSSCERLDGETVVEGKVVDRHTGEAIPNAIVVVHSGKNSSGNAGAAYNTFEFEKQADEKGNFAFRFEGEGDRRYVLQAYKTPGYFTAWDDAASLEEGRNNKKLKIKMQAPAWVRVKFINVPPKDLVARLHLSSYSDMLDGKDYTTLPNFKSDTMFVRKVLGNREWIFLCEIGDLNGQLTRSNPSAYFPALDTTDLVIQY
jgi:hypothetical protein